MPQTWRLLIQVKKSRSLTQDSGSDVEKNSQNVSELELTGLNTDYMKEFYPQDTPVTLRVSIQKDNDDINQRRLKEQQITTSWLC